jgi:hypothetical protein
MNLQVLVSIRYAPQGINIAPALFLGWVSFPCTPQDCFDQKNGHYKRVK